MIVSKYAGSRAIRYSSLGLVAALLHCTAARKDAYAVPVSPIPRICSRAAVCMTSRGGGRAYLGTIQSLAMQMHMHMHMHKKRSTWVNRSRKKREGFSVVV